MVREDPVRLRMQELTRGHVLRPARGKARRPQEAGKVLGRTVRPGRRLIQRVRAEGAAGLVPRSRGTPSHRRDRPALTARGLRLDATPDRDLGPTVAAETLAERQGMAVHAETRRGWLLVKGVTHVQRRKRPHRAWRERRAHGGDRIPLDGSPHDWVEGRGPRCVLMAYIDEVRSRVWARFYEYEGTLPAIDRVQRSIRQYGIPLAVYADTPTTDQSLAPPTRGRPVGRGEAHAFVWARAERAGG